MKPEVLLKAESLYKTYHLSSSGRLIHAVNNVSFEIYPQETFALVGESGSGKSTLARIITGLERQDKGQILFRNKVPDFSDPETRRHIQMVFQDPYSSLNPKMTIHRMFFEIFNFYNIKEKERAEYKDWVIELLQKVGLSERILEAYPFQLSGGQRQRIAIARSLAVNPDLIVLDEPTASLDVSVQAQILELFHHIQTHEKKTYLFISHDLATVELLSHRVGILLNGKLLEWGPTQVIFSKPAHPYTRLLLETSRKIIVPMSDEENSDDTEITRGCPFYPRCPQAMDICRQKFPQEKPVSSDHRVACFLFE